MNTERATAKIAHLLADGENVIRVSTANGHIPEGRRGKMKTHPGALYITDRRVIFFGKTPGRQAFNDFNYRTITNISYTRGMTSHITLFTGGERVEFSAIRYGEAETLVKLIREKIETAVSGNASAVDGVPDQLKKLGELRDAGVLTANEFEDKKADLLHRM